MRKDFLSLAVLVLSAGGALGFAFNIEPAWAQSVDPGEAFKDCAECPEMVVVPKGSYTMGSAGSEMGRDEDESPQHKVTIPASFAVGKHEVTFAEWEACVADGGCGAYSPDDQAWGRDNRPVINVSWNDAQTYIGWLKGKTGKEYRLLSEAEWEYAARAGTTTPFSFGKTITTDQANYDGNFIFKTDQDKGAYREKTAAVGTFPANPFGVHDMHGNVWEWVADCYNDSYSGAPSDGSVWTSNDCGRRVLRGGSWFNAPWVLRSAIRYGFVPGVRYFDLGFRVARSL